MDVFFTEWLEEQEFIQTSDSNIVRQVKRTKRGCPGANDEYKTTFHVAGHIATSLEMKDNAAENAHFPDMKNKPTQRPTARWIFFCFQGVSVLVIDNKMEVTTNIIDRHKVILDVLGKAYWSFYL